MTTPPSSGWRGPEMIPSHPLGHKRTLSVTSNGSARSETEAMALYMAKMAMDKLPMSPKMREDHARAMARAAKLHRERHGSLSSAGSAPSVSPGPAPTVPLPPLPLSPPACAKGKGRALELELEPEGALDDAPFEFDDFLAAYTEDELKRFGAASLEQAPIDASQGFFSAAPGDEAGPSELVYRSEPRLPDFVPRYARRSSPPSPLRQAVNTTELWPDKSPPPVKTGRFEPVALPPPGLGGRTEPLRPLRRQSSRGPRHPALKGFITDAPAVPPAPAWPHQAPWPQRIDAPFLSIAPGFNALGIRWNGDKAQAFGLRTDGEAAPFRFEIGRTLTQVIEMPRGWSGFVQKITGSLEDPATRAEVTFNSFQDMTVFRVSYVQGNNGPVVARAVTGGAYSGSRFVAAQVAPLDICVLDSGGGRVVCGTLGGVNARREAVRRFYRTFLENPRQGAFDPSDNSTWQLTPERRLLLEFW